MQTSYKNCQSCGMPLSKDVKGGGSEVDGSLSLKYCSHCYVGGQFTMPNITADEMKDKVKGKLREMGFPNVLASFMSRNVPKLERWQSR